MAKSYCQQEMGYGIDWAKELINPNWAKLSKAAEDFATCAVGNTSSSIKRNAGGAPANKELNALGYEFMQAIDSRDKVSAKKLLKRINSLASKLDRKSAPTELKLSNDFF